MDVATRWNFSTDSAETAVSQVSVARPVSQKVTVSAASSNDSRVKTAIDLAMQELERALEMKRAHRARVAELSSPSSSEETRAA